jgi:hypothetical protein
VLFSSLFSPLFFSPGVTLATPLILLLSLILLLLVTNLVGIEVALLILLVLLSIEGARVLIILSRPRTATWGLILGESACFESLVTPGDTAWVVSTLGGCTALSDTLGGDVPLFDGVVPQLDNISVKASIAVFNLSPVLRNGFAAAGFLE